MKKILLLGGSAQQVVAIETAKQMGYGTVLCDYLPDNPGQYAADRFYLTSTTDRDAVLKIAAEEQVDGVLAYASDPAAPTAAFVAQELGLPGTPLESVEILCNKHLFRKFLRDNGFHSPEARDYTDAADALRDAGAFTYPLIVKPVDSSGSKGATVLRDAEGLAAALEFAFSFSRCHRVIVERFIERKHPFMVGGDIFVRDGEVILWGLLNCHRDGAVNPLVPVGKSWPLRLDAEDEQNIRNTLSRMVHLLGIRNCAMNVELMVDRDGNVWPVDVGPRCGGNMIPNLLGDMFGVDIVRMCIQAAMGEPVDAEVRQAEGCYATHNLHSSRSGRYRGVRVSEQLAPYLYRECLYKKPGDPVEYFSNASKCLGIVFLRFPEEELMHDMLEHINEHIQILLD